MEKNEVSYFEQMDYFEQQQQLIKHDFSRPYLWCGIWLYLSHFPRFHYNSFDFLDFYDYSCK